MRIRINVLILCVLVLGAGCVAHRCGPNGETPSAVAVRSEVLLKATASWDGALLPAYPQGKPEITILRIEIPAGVKLGSHKHPVINAGVLLRGELTVRSENGDVLHLKAGDALSELVETWHYGENQGSEPAEIIVFYAGTEGQPITVHKD